MADTEHGWSDELVAGWSEHAAASLTGGAMYSGPRVCEIVLEGGCSCAHAHADRPDGLHGCGAAFSLRARWSDHTGLSALLALLVAVLFLQGRTSLQEIDSTPARVALAALLLLAAGSALHGAYRAIRAAHGIPSDEFTGHADSAIGRTIDRVREGIPSGWFRTPEDPRRYDTVGAWRHAFIQLAVNDLERAKVATVASLIAFTAAVVITWLA